MATLPAGEVEIGRIKALVGQKNYGKGMAVKAIAWECKAFEF